MAKLHSYRDTNQARSWLGNNLARVKALFENHSLRDFIFEPFKGVFASPARSIDSQIYSVITQVAIINAVLAGLPGRMGVGVFVVMALEGWMAFRIARHVGINLSKPEDIWKYFGLLAATLGVILYLFRSLLGFAFSLFSIVPGINPLIFAEFFVTDLVGILFLIGFSEAKKNGAFSIPRRVFITAVSSTRQLFRHQLNLLKNTLSPSNIRTVGVRISAYLKGEIPFDMRVVNGEVFATSAMAYLLTSQYGKLEGPIGETFLEAIRLRWSSQLGPEASIEEIASVFAEYEPEQLEGAVNTIKGKMFEIMVTRIENSDSDQWHAVMHDDESFPGSDIIFSNAETGEQVEVSLKAVSAENSHIIEEALARYPELPIMTTDEAASLFDHTSQVKGSGISHDDLQNITNENLDRLIESIEPINAQQIAIGGVVVSASTALWPFVIAYLRGKIAAEQLEQVFQKALGKSSVSLVSRIVYASIFGPVFAWYLLARGVKGIVTMAEPSSCIYIEYKSTMNKNIEICTQ